MPEPKLKTLQIRDARARTLAQRLATQRGVTMTEAVVQALSEELRRAEATEPLAARIRRISADLLLRAGPRRRAMTKAEIDQMWGHD